VLPPGLLVVHDTGGGGENNVAELTRGHELDNPLLEIAELDVVAGGDDTGLVDLKRMLVLRSRGCQGDTYAAVELNHNLAVAVVIDLLELANVAWKCISMSRRIKGQTS
jgi:hypothetical protein